VIVGDIVISTIDKNYCQVNNLKCYSFRSPTLQFYSASPSIVHYICQNLQKCEQNIDDEDENVCKGREGEI